MKTIHFIFQGPDVNLGRFGNITKGTSLPLNPDEARSVMRDPRFKKSEKPFERLEFKPSEPKPGETATQKAEREKADNARESLYDHLNVCFDHNEAEKD